MSLKYKVGDVVVLAANVEQNWNKTFVPGVAVKIHQLCDFNSNDEHYTVSLVSDPSDYWYIKDAEINHETTALLQMSNESGSLVQKISVENDVVSSAVNTSDNGSKSQDNSWYENGEIPPVNTKCIFTGVDVAVEGVILAHVEYRGQYSAIIQCDGDWWPGKVGEFRPWYSDEEIAAQERKKVIDAISDVLIETERMSRYTDVAAHLYELGLRFMEEE